MTGRNVLSLTTHAVEQVKALLAKRGKPSVGIRVGVKTGGCSGKKYYVEYADSKTPYDEVVEYEEVTILIDPKALMYLLGTEMDYQETAFKAGFVFTNPNEKGSCGCGKSFNV
jgi:iron-sulfur cluster assembly protein